MDKAITRNLAVLEQLTAKYNKATMTPAEFANEAGLSETHVRRLCKTKGINAVRIGSRWAIPTVEAAAILSGTKEDKPTSHFAV